MDRQLQPDRFADMRATIAAQRLLGVAIRPERAKWLRPLTDECAVEERDRRGRYPCSGMGSSDGAVCQQGGTRPNGYDLFGVLN